mmetsp:Transcript_44031/g.101790  ORF Transcript_44031/g.101790 Transcript_44031/m.101790 type:complete len:269 (-) Transcript_44031:367-1173(-)
MLSASGSRLRHSPSESLAALPLAGMRTAGAAGGVTAAVCERTRIRLSFSSASARLVDSGAGDAGASRAESAGEAGAELGPPLACADWPTEGRRVGVRAPPPAASERARMRRSRASTSLSRSAEGESVGGGVRALIWSKLVAPFAPTPSDALCSASSLPSAPASALAREPAREQRVGGSRRAEAAARASAVAAARSADSARASASSARFIAEATLRSALALASSAPPNMLMVRKSARAASASASDFAALAVAAAKAASELASCLSNPSR